MSDLKDIATLCKEIDSLTTEVDTLCKERDEARREVCYCHPESAKFAQDRKWDCFKDKTK